MTPGLVALALLALGAGGIPATPVLAGGVGSTKSGPVYKVRVFRAEIPPAGVAGFTRIGVILPPKAKVVKVEAFITDRDYGRRTDGWGNGRCDMLTGDCPLSQTAVARLTRGGTAVDQEVSADFINMSESEMRYGKLAVVFLPIGSLRKTYRPKTCVMRIECGFAGPVDDYGFVPEPDDQIIVLPDRGQSVRDR